MAVLASSRAGNLVRAVLAILMLAFLFREMYLLWFFHTAAWTSRPAQIRSCDGRFYNRTTGPDRTLAEVEAQAGGAVHRIGRSPTLKSVVAYKPGKDCPVWIFAQVGGDDYVTYVSG